MNPSLLVLLLACNGEDPDKSPADDTSPVTTPADDTGTLNGAPGAPVVAISPESPGDSDALTVVIVEEAVDPDGDAVSYRFAWTRDGVDAGTTEEISASDTLGGEAWAVSAFASDGSEEGPAGTATVVIGVNLPPSPPVIELLPAAPLPGDDLELVIVTPAVDPEGDPLTQTITWTLDGGGLGSLDGATGVPGNFVDSGEVYTVTVSVEDGVNPAVSATATATIPNQPPDVRSLSIEPTLPEDSDDLYARYGVNDPDGDSVTSTLTWYRDGVVAADAGGNTVVPAELTTVGEVWELELAASDGIDTTVERSGPVTIFAQSTAIYYNTLVGTLTADTAGDWESFSGTWSMILTTTGPEYGDMDCANSWAVSGVADTGACPACEFVFDAEVTTNGLTTSSGPICDLLDQDGTASFQELLRGSYAEFEFYAHTGPVLALPRYYYTYGLAYAYPATWSAASGYVYGYPGYSTVSDVRTYEYAGATLFYATFQLEIGIY